ncbi:MAG: tyrosine-type recombinase/integrase [Acidobacteriaceae bacterium]
MNTLREALQEYIDLRRGLGYKMRCEGLLLPRFVEFMEERHAEHIGVRLALEWAQRASVQPAEWARRLCFVRGFARHRSATDSQTEIPPLGLLPHRSTRARPHLYTEDDIRRLLDAALELPVSWPSTSLRPWVFHGLLGLLSVTGLRLSEALNLEVADVDVDQSVLTIRGAKFGQWRLVPIHRSTSEVLADYIERRAQFFRHQVSTYLFVTRRGNRLDSGHVHRTFYTLSRSTGLRAVGASKGPRLHDFRHRFAVQTLTRWYEAGKDPGREMPLLSTYLGHVCVAGTYWYLNGSPELMAQAMTRLERRWGESS